MKFRYNNTLKVILAFYENCHGVIKDYRFSYDPYTKLEYIYSVEIDNKLVKFSESDLELVWLLRILIIIMVNFTFL